jgi:hypothetical protein
MQKLDEMLVRELVAGAGKNGFVAEFSRRNLSATWPSQLDILSPVDAAHAATTT